MTGIYGAGRAFNLKYRPNGPLKTFIYDRRMPIFDFGARGPRGGGWGSFMQENITIDYGKRGFWGNLADIFTGLAAGIGVFTQVFGMFGGGKSDVAAEAQQGKTPKAQGATSEAELKNLTELGKATGYTTVVKNPDGTYTAYNPTTHQNITGDYKTVQEAMMKKPEKSQVEEPTSPKKEVKEEPEEEEKEEPEIDQSQSSQCSHRTKRAKAKGNESGVTGKDNEIDGKDTETKKVSDSENKLSHYEVGVKYEIRQKFGIPGSWHGEAFAEFTDLNGQKHHYRADCKIPGSYDGVKKILDEILKQKIEADGFKDVKFVEFGKAKAAKRQGVKTDNTNSTDKAKETKKVSDEENKSHAYTAQVKWVPIKVARHPIFKYVEMAEYRIITSFTDLNGERHVFEATGSAEMPNGCEARAKNDAVKNVKVKIEGAGFTNVKV